MHSRGGSKCKFVDHAEESAAGLTAFYDLSVSPTGFDFAVFLTLAEMARRRAGQVIFRVVFVPAEVTGFWSNEIYDDQYKLWRLYHLLVPLTTLFPACSGVTVCQLSRRRPADSTFRGPLILPEGYLLEATQSEVVPVVRARLRRRMWGGVAGMAYAACRRGVCRTMARASGGWPQSGHYYAARGALSPEQNSNLKAWAAFARSLDTGNFFPVFVRDTGAALWNRFPRITPEFRCLRSRSFQRGAESGTLS